MDKIKQYIPEYMAFVILMVAGGISLHFTGLEYGLLIGYILGATLERPLAGLIRDKVLKK